MNQDGTSCLGCKSTTSWVAQVCIPTFQASVTCDALTIFVLVGLFWILGLPLGVPTDRTGSNLLCLLLGAGILFPWQQESHLTPRESVQSVLSASSF